MAAHRPGIWRVCSSYRLLAAFAASGWLLFFFSRPAAPPGPGPHGRPHFHVPDEGGEGAQGRWRAAQEHVLAAEQQAAESIAAGHTGIDSGSSSTGGSPVGNSTEPPSLTGASVIHEPLVQQLVAPGIEPPAATAAAEHAPSAAHAPITEPAPEAVILESSLRPADSVSRPLSAVERQQQETSAALRRVAATEALRRAISASLAAASEEGAPPAAAMGCAKACSFGEAPGYWRADEHNRRRWTLYDDDCAVADLLSLHVQPRAPVEPVAYLGENAMFLEAPEADLLAGFDWMQELANRNGTPGNLTVPHVADLIARARQYVDQIGRQRRSKAAAPQVAVRRRLAALASAAAEHISRVHGSRSQAAAVHVARLRQHSSRHWRAPVRRRLRSRLSQHHRQSSAAGGTHHRFSRTQVSDTGGIDSALDDEDLTGLNEGSATAHDIGKASDGGGADAAAEAEAAAHVDLHLQAAAQQSLGASSSIAAGSSGVSSGTSSGGGLTHDGGKGDVNRAVNGTAADGTHKLGVLLMGDSIDRDTLMDVCAAASGGLVQPDYFLTHMAEECRVEFGSTSRCLICELPTLVVANQMLWSVHPTNPLQGGAGFLGNLGKRKSAETRLHEGFHLGKRKSAETRLHEGWQLFVQRVGRPPDLLVVAVNFWDLALYTRHGLGLQPHLAEPLLHAWRRNFGDLLSMAQALAGNTTKLVYHTAPVPAAGSTALAEVREYKLARVGHVAQLNAAGRAAARAAGISFVDMALMTAALHTPAEYLKDNLHPQPWLLLEVFNMYLNILQESAQQKC